MKKIFNLFAIGAVLVMASSCDLDLAPKGTITYNPGQPIITNESDLIGFEANIMYSFRSLDAGVYEMASDVMVDYFNATTDFANNYGAVHRADDTLTPSDYEVEDNWAGPYSAINNFNIFISGTEKDVPEELQADVDVARGEAFLARAYAYMHLARHFAKAYDPATAATDLCVPLVTVYEQTARPARATVAEIYAQIKADLDAASTLLAGVAGSARAERPTIDAVKAMYARYYLDTKDYAKAAEYASAVIATGKYKLASTADEMTKEWRDDEGTEPILQFYASTSEGAGGHGNYLNMGQDANVGAYIRPYFIPTAKLIDAYDETDLRLQLWYNRDYPSFHLATYYNVDEVQYLTFVKYFGNAKKQLFTGLPNTAQARKPFLISEMYLIAAEGYVNSGNTTAALECLNAIQTARGANLSTAATMDAVKNEWFRETVGEGLRMSCLKRWGEGYEARTPQAGAAAAMVVFEGAYYDQRSMPASDHRWVWPVPLYEMQTNLNLEQNPGYSVE